MNYLIKTIISRYKLAKRSLVSSLLMQANMSRSLQRVWINQIVQVFIQCVTLQLLDRELLTSCYVCYIVDRIFPLFLPKISLLHISCQIKCENFSSLTKHFYITFKVHRQWIKYKQSGKFQPRVLFQYSVYTA